MIFVQSRVVSSKRGERKKGELCSHSERSLVIPSATILCSSRSLGIIGQEKRRDQGIKVLFRPGTVAKYMNDPLPFIPDPDMEVDSGSNHFIDFRSPNSNPNSGECMNPMLVNAFPIGVIHSGGSVEGEGDLRMEPSVGLEFDSADEAREFYSLYAKRDGFKIRIGQLYRSRRDGSVSSRRFVCSKEGFQLNSRTGCPAFIRVQRRDSGKWAIDQIQKDHNHELGLEGECSSPVLQQGPPVVTKSLVEVLRRTKVKLLGQIDDGVLTPSGIINFKKQKRGGDGRQSIAEPYTGLEFNTANEAYEYYQTYAENVGFRVRIGQLFRSKNDGSITSRRFVCSKEGFQHPSRVGCGAFMRIKRKDSGSLDVEVDNGSCRSVFWANSRSRYSCSQFGDVIIFDTSYRKSNYVVPFATFVGVDHHKQPVLLGSALIANESKECFTWLFQTWFKAMSRCRPKSIIADQDMAIQQTIAEVFPGTHHRFSSWQIRAKERENLRSMPIEFRYKYEKCIYESESVESFFGTLVNGQTPLREFIPRYEQGLEQRGGRKEDFNSFNLHAFSQTKEAIEEQCRRLYTFTIFKIFQDASTILQLYWDKDLRRRDDLPVLGKTVGNENDKHAVTFSAVNLSVNCSCQMFEFEGVLCRHVLKVFKLLNIENFLLNILPRWLRNAEYRILCGADSRKLWQMMRDASVRTEDLNAPSTSSSRRTSNVFPLLAWREVSPRTKRSSRKLWGEGSKSRPDSLGPNFQATRDARSDILSWVEAESLRHFSSKYCPLVPPPRSTIAAAFSPDGKTLASTHGDHTVKIIDCQTGNCLKVLSGHRRTPWVVRFHPLYPEILASGSLDHEVRLWNANSAEYHPTASIAFHAQGEVLAVASGHKLYIWHYNRRGEASSPSIILKTRRSLRAVHFHPYAAPILLTAEVNDFDAPDSSMTVATSPGYLRYPALTVYLANDRSNLTNELPLMSLPFMIWPSFSRDNGRTSLQNTDGDIGSNALLHCQKKQEAILYQLRWKLMFPILQRSRWRQWRYGQSVGQSSVSGRSSSRHRSSHSRMVSSGTTGESGYSNIIHDNSDPQPATSRIQSELATSLAEAATAELPCTVKLRIWPHDMKDPCAFLDPEKCRLTIPHLLLKAILLWCLVAVMVLSACVACMLPHLEVDPGVQSQLNSDIAGVATSPTRPLFGLVFASRAIRAAHCLTSIQFSPTSEYILLAYGRRHSSLLKIVVIDGQTTVPIYTILEVYRVSDMELVRVLPSAEDEVNVACFHPSVGCGLVYGTKEGKLRILQYDSSNGMTHNMDGFLDENMLETDFH
ncbi:Protein FAR1-RELATED SEQUENCE 7 [Hibiscus syriacus]|uniref:Protein FAR1-RELATED SEQUENCE 7 n=1 Tax=Hibiscus syriacus TaxID=106335 RepID=A0A6A2Y955_HIBSY|nr:Protein FAR1-RELATED SEQUENCE 7 [Hibiscus syriacus]